MNVDEDDFENEITRLHFKEKKDFKYFLQETNQTLKVYPEWRWADGRSTCIMFKELCELFPDFETITRLTIDYKKVLIGIISDLKGHWLFTINRIKTKSFFYQDFQRKYRPIIRPYNAFTGDCFNYKQFFCPEYSVCVYEIDFSKILQLLLDYVGEKFLYLAIEYFPQL